MIHIWCEECKFHYGEVKDTGGSDDIDEYVLWTCRCVFKKKIINLKESKGKCYYLNSDETPKSRFKNIYDSYLFHELTDPMM